MDPYVTGGTIRRFRESAGMTQTQLADRLQVSDKAVSKWENGRGYPDITLLEPLAAALGISVTELLSGSAVTNQNVSGNLLRGKWAVCPVCGNVLYSVGEAVVNCHGVTLPPLEAEIAGGEHDITVEPVEDEYYITVAHPMTKSHYISFLAAVSDDRVQMVKLYPEGAAATRVSRRGLRKIVAFCNRDGLFEKKIR